jgi:predicted RNase H-like nuclease
VEVVGVDGTKGGWVAIALDSGRYVGDYVLRPLDTRFEELAEAQVIAVDIPIRFGPRKADRAARAFLRGAASTVFTTPPKALLEIPFGPGRGLSAQSHALGARILHVTELARSDSRFYEIHPEVSFRAMNGGRALEHGKKSAAGALKRIELLRRQGIDLTSLGAAASVPLDDVLDAGAAAWSAHRILAGKAESFPDPPEALDDHPVAIWY